MTKTEREYDIANVITHRRYVQTVPDPRPSLWPWMFFFFLVLLFWIGAVIVAPAIERDIHQRVTESLNQIDSLTLQVDVDGQHVHISGRYADWSSSVLSETPVAIVESLVARIARGTLCHTALIKDLLCPTYVQVVMQALPPSEPSKPQSYEFSHNRGYAQIALSDDLVGRAKNLTGVAEAATTELSYGEGKSKKDNDSVEGR